MEALLDQKLNRWCRDLPEGPELENILTLVNHLEKQLYSQFAPSSGPRTRFWQRMADWLSHLPKESDQKKLFQLVPHLFFVGYQEFQALYRSAFNGPIARWLVEQTGIRFDSPGFEQVLRTAIGTTWFCPITDSMDINAFYNTNRISGRNIRFLWHSVGKLGDLAKVNAFICDSGIQRIVLLEDLVCTGTQFEQAVINAASLAGSPPVMVVPLILCPCGWNRIRSLEARFPQVKFEPVLILEESDFIKPKPAPGEAPLFAEIRKLAVDNYIRLVPNCKQLERRGLLKSQKPYGPFGFGESGGLIVLYRNCPANTLPLIHHAAADWSPLFPRNARV
jgi:hypothetical protein